MTLDEFKKLVDSVTDALQKEMKVQLAKEMATLRQFIKTEIDIAFHTEYSERVQERIEKALRNHKISFRLQRNTYDDY